MIHTDLLQLDAEHRQRAIEPNSYIVEAPAGAGKTELLTQRYLRLLALVNEPEEIVAITFTNKAAAEMRSRILGSLQDAHDQVAVDKPHKQVTRALADQALRRSHQQGWHLLDQPARLRINTIDSFSSLLARQMPLMSRFGAQPAVVEDAGPLYEEAAKRALAGLETEAAGGPVATALHYFDNDAQRLMGQLAQMLAKRDQWLPQAGQQAVADEAMQALQHLVRHDIEAAARTIPPGLQRRLMPIARYAASNLPCEHCLSLLLDWETPIQVHPQALPMWLALCDLLLTSADDFRKALTKNQGLPPGEHSNSFKQALLEILEQLPGPAALAKLRRLPDLRHLYAEKPVVAALADLLKLAAAHLVAVFQEAGEVDFVEVSQRALQALEDQSGPTDLALRLDYRIQHLLVDEFQDTSPMQVRLLQTLMSGWETGDGRTIFCVGDPMQSIYRFRKADVGLFLQVAQFGIGHLHLDSLHLTRNNRSCPAVIDWVNDAFARVFPDEDSVTRGAISYREFAATRSSLPGEGVQVHALVAPAGSGADQLAILEAQRLADIIEHELAEDPQRSIAVLVRARDHLQGLVAEIRRNRPHLRFQAVKVESLAQRQSVQDVLALTRALLHRADRVNWLAILRAPWCGLLLADLHLLAAHDHHSTIWQLMQDDARLSAMSSDGQHRLLHVRGILAEAFAHQGRQSVRRWVESTWLKLGGPQSLWDAGDVRDVQALLDLIDKLDSAGRLDVTALEAAIAKLYAAPDVHADGCLQFMTIHNSKGLEFDTVILPGLHRQPAKTDTPLLLWEEVAIDDSPAQLVAAPWRPKHRRDDTPSTYDYLQGLEKERGANETARVLYVAATRAIRRLHLVAALSLGSKDEVKPLAGSLLELLWSTVGGEFLHAAEHLLPVAPPQAAIDQAGFTPQLVRLQAPAIPEVFTQPGIPVQQAYTLGEDEDAAADDGLPGTRLEASIGTLAHRYLELVTQQGLASWDIERLATLAPVMAHWLTAQGHAAAEAGPAAQIVVKMLQTTLQSEDGRWVLQPHQHSGEELAIARAERLLVSTHVVDRTFVADGVRWVIDYKSIKLAPGLDDAALLRQAQRYSTQLARYASLFAADGLPVRQAVLFISLGRLVILPPG